MVMGMIYELFFMEPLYSSIARQRAPPVLVSHAFQLALKHAEANGINPNQIALGLDEKRDNSLFRR